MAKATKYTYKGLSLVLIKPSKYDDEGYVIQHWRGVLPSNTLSCIYALTQQETEAGRFGDDFDIQINAIDETVMRVDPKQIKKKYSKRGYKLLVGLVGVQTNQFPRAMDIAKQLKALDVEVMVGGFHVSGAIAMADTFPPECQELIDAGVILVKGEIEEVWGDILEEVIEDRASLFYDITEKPDLYKRAIPRISPKYMNRFAFNKFGTIDAGRGCPFNCSFCTIINVQGRKMRYRSYEMITDQIRKNYRDGKGINYYFFTDDNFARNPEWERVFDALIKLRHEENIKIDFMMQVDLQSTKIKNFVRKAALAGCTQVFLGMESINDDNLKASSKRQNKTKNYQDIVQQWHDAGIAVHVGYIIGFPFDTYESVMRDVDRIKNEVKVDQASFFMLTPLPGSRDHQVMDRNGDWMDPDYNKFDSFHATVNHPKMSEQDWVNAYQDAWKSFYSPEHMKAALLRQNGHTYWGLFKNYVWYRSSMIENNHPMICGFFRLKDRKIRRPGFPIESRWTHYKKRFEDTRYLLREYWKLYFELQEIWLQTRHEKEYAKLKAFKENLGQTVVDWQDSWQQKLDSLRDMGDAVGNNIKSIQRNLASIDIRNMTQRQTSRLRALDIMSVRKYATRQHLNNYWLNTYRKLKRGEWFKINPFSMGLNAFRETKLAIHFLFHMKKEMVNPSGISTA